MLEATGMHNLLLKQWSTFVNAYLSEILSKPIHIVGSIKGFKAFLTNWGAWFVQLSLQEIVRNSTGHLLITQPMGTINQFSFCPRPFVSCPAIIQWSWEVLLDKALVGNWSFQHMYFSHAYSCGQGNFTMEDMLSSGLLYFCGYHPNVQLFPGYFHTKLICSHYPGINVALVGFFSVTDKDHIVSLQHRNYSLHLVESVELSTLYFPMESSVTFMFHISVQKHTRVVVRAAVPGVESILVYDGPIEKCSNVKQQSNQFQCSTYQCLVKLNAGKHFVNIKVTSLQITSRHLPVSMKLYVGERGLNLSLPNGNCFKKTCNFLILGTKGRLNISLLFMHFKGEFWHSALCQFGGILTFEEGNAHVIHSGTFCHNESTNYDFSRNFYTFNSSTNIMLYFYEEVTLLNVKLKISETVCKLVQLDNHLMSMNCVSRASTSNCHKSIRETENLFHTSLACRAEQVGFHSICVSLSVRECIVLQPVFTEKSMRSLPSTEPRGRFIHKIKLRKDTSSGATYILTLQGMLRKTHSHFVFKNSFVVQVHTDNIQASNTFCKLEGNISQTTCYENWKPQSDWLSSHRDRDCPVLSTLDVFTPFGLHVPEFAIELFPHTQSWVVVTVSKMPSTTDYIAETFAIKLQQMRWMTKFVSDHQKHQALLFIFDSPRAVLDSMEMELAKESKVFASIVMSLSPLPHFKHKFLSPPAEITTVRFCSKETEVSFTVRWIANSTTDYQNLNQNLMPCQRVVHFAFHAMKCSSSIKTLHNSIEFVLISKDYFSKSDKSVLFSWNHALSICWKLNLSLPVFESRQAQARALDFLSLKRVHVIVEAFFIGVRVTKKPVSYLNTCSCTFSALLFSCDFLKWLCGFAGISIVWSQRNSTGLSRIHTKLFAFSLLLQLFCT